MIKLAKSVDNHANWVYNKQRTLYRGVEQLAARWAHNPKVVSSNLTPATRLIKEFKVP